MRAMPLIQRLIVLACALLVLSACAAPPTPEPTATAPSREASAVLSDVLDAPQRWSGQQIVLVAPVRATSDERVLTMQPRAPAPSRSDEIWLAEPLPAAVLDELDAGIGVIRARGTLSPPGAYGRDQQHTYQFVAQEVTVLQPEPTTIANLARNPQALDRVLLRVRGTLLAQPNDALLVEDVSESGVPTAASRQIKLSRSAIDAAALEALQTSGEVRWGAVEVVGWWQDGTLIPLAIDSDP
jgi:hypothetical protein